MAKNITLMGADYPDVPAVQLPQTGGGTTTFYDIQVIDNLNSDSSTDALSAKQGKVLNENIAETQTLNQDTYSGSSKVYKAGRLAFITCVSGQYYCNANEAIRIGSATAAPWVIGNGFRPVSICEIKETLNNKRIVVDTDGKVTCTEALNGVPLRFSGCWIVA